MRKEEEDMSSSNNIEEIEGGNRSLPAPFLTKTYDLVEDPETDEIVSWAPEGLVTFVVWRPAEFARDILPNYFKHNNFSSFVRQLNTYGFRKIVPDRWEFANEFFRKGEKHLLSDIHRRKSCSSSSPHVTRPWAEGGDPWDSYSPIFLNSTNTINTNINNSNINNNINNNRAISLLDENQRLRSDNAVLICELTRLRKLYTDAVSFVQQNLQHHFNNNNNKGLPLSNIMNNNNNSGKWRELCKLAPGPNKSDPLVQKSPPSLEPVKEEEAEVEERRKKSSCNSSNPPPPKLFGVPLLLQHHHVTNPSGPKVPVDMDLSLRLPVSKRARILSLDSPCFW